MIAPILAGLPPRWSTIIAVGVLLVLMIAVGFVWATASRRGEQSRRVGLGLLSLFVGPLVGIPLAGLAHASGGIMPRNVGDTYITFAGVGGFAGFLAGLAFALTGLLASNGPEKKPSGEPEL